MPRPKATGSAASELVAAFAAAWARRPPGKVVLAVSGGSDSTALMHLVAASGARPSVVTVDHGLRPGSAAEAEAAGDSARRLGLDHAVLTWKERPAGNLQAAARVARYRLIADWARRHDIATIVTGHTLDDQAETVLLRLARGSGVDGLAAMRETSRLGEMTLFRPLLGFRRADLRAWLRQAGHDWFEDPLNDEPAFDRVRARAALDALASLGLTAERLARTAAHMARAADALEADARDWATRHVRWGLTGEAVFDRAAWAALPAELRLRLLARLLSQVSGHVYRPRFEALQGLVDALLSDAAARRSLHGCLIRPGPGTVAIFREPAAVTPPVPVSPGRTVWDHRWQMEGPGGEGLTVGALGETGLALLGQARTTADWRAAPRLGRLAAPAIWRGGRLVAVPLAGVGEDEWQVRLLTGDEA